MHRTRIVERVEPLAGGREEGSIYREKETREKLEPKRDSIEFELVRTTRSVDLSKSAESEKDESAASD